MKINWRVSIFAAGGAFLLSLLVGVLGGVGFGAVLLRALFGGVIFGLGGAGLALAIERFIPELKSTLATTDEQTGGAVDIVVDDDTGAIMQESIGNPDSEGIRAREGSEAVLEMDTIDEDVIEELDGEEDSLAEGSANDGVDSDDEAADSSSLPDMEMMSESFGEAPSNNIQDVDEAKGSGGDPELMARAIRTVLKREE